MKKILSVVALAALCFIRADTYQVVTQSVDKNKFEAKFNLAIPKELSGVETRLLNPINTWANQDEYIAQRDKLATMFSENFRRYEDVKEGVEFAKAGPKL